MEIVKLQEKSIETEIMSETGEFSGKFEIYEVNGPDIKTENTFDHEPVKTVRKPDMEVNGDRFSYVFPPHSYVMIKGALK